MIWSLILFQAILMKATVSFAAAEDNSLSRSAYLVTRENKHLVDHVVKKFESPSLMACSQSCLRKSWCTSTNFKPKSSGQETKATCELNKNEFDPINHNSKLIDQPGTIFSMFLKGCLMYGCVNGGSCRFDKKEETFTCSCKHPWSGDKCEVETAILGSFPKQPGKSCMEIKTTEGERALSGKYWLSNTGSTSVPVFCHMASAGEVWTLIARFSNNDTNKWMKESGDWWYDKNVTNGKTTDPSNNFDMISSAFWLVSGNEFKITRSDDPQHTALLQTTGDCLGGQTFRSKITSYGDFRNGKTWRLGKPYGCQGNCTVQYGGKYESTEGFNRANCNGTILSADKIGFWCDKGTWDGSVMMIGGSGGDCKKTDHGIGITVAKLPSFNSTKGRAGRDFGNATYGKTTKVYSLNLWIR